MCQTGKVEQAAQQFLRALRGKRSQQAFARASVAAARAADPHEGDLFAYNVISVSAADLVRVRELLQSAFRDLRSLVAASEPTECAALINVQLMGWNAGATLAYGAASA